MSKIVICIIAPVIPRGDDCMVHRPRACLIVLGVVALFGPAAAAKELPAKALPMKALMLASDDSTTAPGAAAPQAPVPPPIDLGEEITPVRPADLAYGIAAQLRWVSIPSWMLNA